MKLKYVTTDFRLWPCIDEQQYNPYLIDCTISPLLIYLINFVNSKSYRIGCGPRISVRGGGERDFADIVHWTRMGEENLGHKIRGYGSAPPPRSAPEDHVTQPYIFGTSQFTQTIRLHPKCKNSKIPAGSPPDTGILGQRPLGVEV